MTVCVLGARGLVGGAFVHFLRSIGFQVLAPTRQELEMTKPGQIKDFFFQHQVAYIINCAAYTNVDGAEDEVDLAYALNAVAPRIVAESAKQLGAFYLHFSTDYVFDGEASVPYKETDECNPINIYGKSKREGEVSVMEVMPEACIIRTSWVFGRGGKNFVSSVLQLLQSKEEVSAVTDQIGKPTYVPDLVKNVWELRDAAGLFHVAGGTALSRFEIAEDMRNRLLQHKMSINCQRVNPVLANAFSTRAPRPHYSALDTVKVESYLGRRMRPWEEIIEEYLNAQR